MSAILTRFVCGAFAAAFLLSASAASTPTKPNILMIVGDDMGFGDVGFHGCKDIPTPNLDALAKSGVQFTSGYVSGPYCSPTRAGLMTGRYQERFGHEFNPSRAGAGLPLTETTIATRLKAGGYSTGMVGKWHLGSLAEFHPQQRGFEEFFGFLGGSHSYFSWNGMLRGTHPADGKEYFTDAFGREACQFVEKHKGGKPWFLYLAFNAVHTPMHATDERLAKFASIKDQKRSTYAAMMYAMDENIGKVLRKLDETGQRSSTLITFISDNGGPNMNGTTVNGSSNLPLRGSKRTTLEGGIHVPFLVSWKDHITPGVYKEPVIQLDLTATALNLAGAKTGNLDGINLLPFLSGENKGIPHEVLYWRFGKQMAIRMGDYKLVRYDANVDGVSRRGKDVIGPCLYDLSKDLGENHDLFGEKPEKAKELQAKWDAWNTTLVAPLWGGGNSDNDGDPSPGRRKKK